MWGLEVYEKSLYLPLSFAVNLILVFKKKSSNSFNGYHVSISHK